MFTDYGKARLKLPMAEVTSDLATDLSDIDGDAAKLKRYRL